MESGITQAQVAERMRCTESQVSRWESCQLRMDIRDLDEYLEAIRVDFLEFMTKWKRLSDELGAADIEVKLPSQKRAKPNK